MGTDPATPTADGSLSADDLSRLRKDFTANASYRVLQNALTSVQVNEIAIDRELLNGADHSVSHLIDDWKVTNQEASGRCWIFAGLNLLRAGVMKKLNVGDFEFSQNYVTFWDKFERCNYFLEAMIETADRDVDDRTVSFLLQSVANDGGQWNMFIAVVQRYGLVPKAYMPETKSSSNTGQLNMIMRRLLREGARTVREASKEGIEAAREAKDQILGVLYRVLSLHLGTPPEQFLWQWTDKERKFTREGMITPQEFAAKYVDLPLDDYVCLVHDPRPTSPIGRTFTVEYLGNVVGAPPVVYLNVEIDVMKDVAAKSLQAGEPVWFGCDTGKMMSTDHALWDVNLFDYSAVYDTPFVMSKAERLLYQETAMTHAMLFTGVDMVDGKPRRWRVENSWGEERGRKGFFTMNDSWFEEHMFEIAARKDLLPAELQAALDTEPIVLPAWDPMGALAQ